MNLEISKVLIVSTSHITLDDGRRLNDPDSVSSVPFIVYRAEFFHLVAVFAPLVEDEDHPAMSPQFQALVKLAQDNDCEWLKLDGDGPQLDGYEVFSW